MIKDKRKLQVSVDKIIDAFIDVTDGKIRDEIRSETGLSDKRCREIITIRNKILFDKEGYK